MSPSKHLHNHLPSVRNQACVPDAETEWDFLSIIQNNGVMQTIVDKSLTSKVLQDSKARQKAV